MKKYKITVELDESNRKALCEDWEFYFDSEDERDEYINLWNETNGKHKLETLEEYFKLINDVRVCTNGMYRIYNDGTLIMEDE